MSEEKNKRGFELSAEQKVAVQVQESILKDVKLRQWCVEKALAGAVSATGGFAVVELAREIFEFVSQDVALTVRGQPWDEKA